MAAYARCRVCGYRLEVPVAIVYQEGPELQLEDSQKRELLGRLAEHVSARHPKEFKADPAAVEALENWRNWKKRSGR